MAGIVFTTWPTWSADEVVLPLIAFIETRAGAMALVAMWTLVTRYAVLRALARPY